MFWRSGSILNAPSFFKGRIPIKLIRNLWRKLMRFNSMIKNFMNYARTLVTFSNEMNEIKILKYINKYDIIFLVLDWADRTLMFSMESLSVKVLGKSASIWISNIQEKLNSTWEPHGWKPWEVQEYEDIYEKYLETCNNLSAKFHELKK